MPKLHKYKNGSGYYIKATFPGKNLPIGLLVPWRSGGIAGGAVHVCMHVSITYQNGEALTTETCTLGCLV